MNKSYTATLKEFVQNAKIKLPDFQNDFVKVAAYFGYQFMNGSQTREEVTSFLYSEIANILREDKNCFDKDIFRKVGAQLIIEEIVYDKGIEDIFSTNGIILDATRQVELCEIGNRDKWEKACELALAYKKIGVHDPYKSMYIHTKEINTAYAIKYFRRININIETEDSVAHGVLDTLRLISEKISNYARALGCKAVHYINDDLKQYYSKRDQRFSLQRNTHAYSTLRKPSTPYGYLLNITMPYIGWAPSKKVKHQEAWNSFKEMSTNLVALYAIEPYSSFEAIDLHGSDLISFMQKSTLFDHIFMFRQLPLKRGIEFFSNCLNLGAETDGKFQKKYGITQEEVLGLFSLISLYFEGVHETSCRFDPKKFMLRQCFITPEAMAKVLQVFSVEPKKINGNYKLPTDYQYSNLDEYPFYKVSSSEYIVINSALFPMQFYERYAALLRGCDDQTDKKIGGNIEIYLSKKLSEKNITHLWGEKYKVDAQKRAYLDIKNEEGECDLIIETNSTIFFCEIKKKGITKYSASGNDLSLLNDVAGSLLSSQIQIGNHEAIIRKYGKIEFKSGKKVELNNRGIQRVSISLFDYQGFQDQSIIDSLGSLFSSKLSIKDNDKEKMDILDNIQKKIQTLNKQYSLESMKYYTGLRRPFSNIRYFSAFQILEILENCKSNDDFEKEINVTLSSSDGSRNWYSQYKRMRGNKILQEIVPHLNGAIWHS